MPKTTRESGTKAPNSKASANNMMHFGYAKRLRDLREDSDLTQKEIADRLGTSQTMYARYEREANELPVRHLILLADLYNVSTDYILMRTNNPCIMR